MPYYRNPRRAKYIYVPPTRQQLENRKKDGPYLVLGGLALIVAVMTLGGLLNIIFSIT